jgi:hypothetical protein
MDIHTLFSAKSAENIENYAARRAKRPSKMNPHRFDGEEPHNRGLGADAEHGARPFDIVEHLHHALAPEFLRLARGNVKKNLQLSEA